MTPYELAQAVESAYDSRDRDALHRFLARLVAMADAKVKPPHIPALFKPETLDPSD